MVSGLTAFAKPKPQTLRNVKLTTYDANCRKCGTGNFTRTDKVARPGMVAVDRHVIPLGSRVHIPGMGWFMAEDTGGAVNGRHIDICIARNGRHHNLTSRFGVRRIRYVTFIPPEKRRKRK